MDSSFGIERLGNPGFDPLFSRHRPHTDTAFSGSFGGFLVVLARG